MLFRCTLASLLLFHASLLAEDPAAGKQVEQQLELGNSRSISYLLYLPKDYDGSKSYPFVLFLHGRGESNGPLSMVKKWGPPRLIDEGRHMPYIVCSPQCPQDAFWNQAGEQSKLVQLLDHLEQSLPIDRRRMYLTGLSMGGYGSWALAASYPDKFAAVAPICGAGNPADAEKLKDVPLWVWHGLEDKSVPPSGSEEMVQAIRAAGGTKIIYTSLEGVGHNSWSSAYAAPELYTWFDRHQVAIDGE